MIKENGALAVVLSLSDTSALEEAEKAIFRGDPNWFNRYEFRHDILGSDSFMNSEPEMLSRYSLLLSETIMTPGVVAIWDERNNSLSHRCRLLAARWGAIATLNRQNPLWVF